MAMNPTLVGSIVFAFAMAGALFGLALARRMPGREVDKPSRESIKLAVGLIATMTALVLGLVTASAKTTFDSLNSAVKSSAVDVLALDRTLARFGPETADVRADLKRAIEGRVALIWPDNALGAANRRVLEQASSVEDIGNRVLELVPANDVQKSLKDRATALSERLLEGRGLLHAGSTASVPLPFLTALTLWITITFTIFGMLAPSNRVVILVMASCAMSVGTALFIVLEMDDPFDGVLIVSSEPLKQAIAQLNR